MRAALMAVMVAGAVYAESPVSFRGGLDSDSGDAWMGIGVDLLAIRPAMQEFYETEMRDKGAYVEYFADPANPGELYAARTDGRSDAPVVVSETEDKPLGEAAESHWDKHWGKYAGGAALVAATWLGKKAYDESQEGHKDDDPPPPAVQITGDQNIIQITPGGGAEAGIDNTTDNSH